MTLTILFFFYLKKGYSFVYKSLQIAHHTNSKFTYKVFFFAINPLFSDGKYYECTKRIRNFTRLGSTIAIVSLELKNHKCIYIMFLYFQFFMLLFIFFFHIYMCMQFYLPRFLQVCLLNYIWIFYGNRVSFLFFYSFRFCLKRSLVTPLIHYVLVHAKILPLKSAYRFHSSLFFIFSDGLADLNEWTEDKWKQMLLSNSIQIRKKQLN